jgi:hypothetical protein
MLLHNVLPHAAKTAVLVNGTIYNIDAKGNAEVGKAEDAKKLLSCTAWKLGAVGTKIEKPVVIVPAKATKIELLGNDGLPVSQTPTVELKEQVDTPTVLKGKGKGKGKEQKATKSESKKAEDAEDPGIPAKGEPWPDPLPSYSMEWLTKCAKAYKVKLPKGASRKDICALLVEAMYE